MLCSLKGVVAKTATLLRLVARGDRGKDIRQEADYLEHIFRNEIYKHLGQVERGEEPVSEFVRHYCIGPDPKPLVITEADYPLEAA